MNSATIDDRVVQMRFDNSDFEKNTKQSMDTLKDLSKSLDNVDSKSFSDLSNAVDDIADKFSGLGAIATGALAAIGAKIGSLALDTVYENTLGQVAAGFEKFGQKTTAVQTILNAIDEGTDKGLADFLQLDEANTKMDYVTQTLEKLNWFTDETSYSFTDMTSNIGKFTAAGVGLDEATNAMMGIATWASISGASVQEASRAMYNISQSLGTGHMQLIDWKSIENANMATKQFKELAITVAEEMGVLEEGQVTYKNFRETLTKGWLDSNVLNATLSVYGSAADAIYNIVEASGDLNDEQLMAATIIDALSENYELYNGDLNKVKEAMEGLGYTMEDVDGNSLISTLSDLGLKALQAAQECKTFADVTGYVKEAVSSTWAKIFELIFGNYEQAKIVWTELCEWMYQTLVSPVETLQHVLSEWNSAGGRLDLFGGVDDDGNEITGAFENIGPILKEIVAPLKEVLSTLFGFIGDDSPVKTIASLLKTLTEKFKSLTEKVLEFFSSDAYQGSLVFKALNSLAKVANKLFGIVKSGASLVIVFFKKIAEFVSGPILALRLAITNIIEPLKELINKLFPNLGKLGIAKKLTDVADKLKESNFLMGASTFLVTKILNIGDKIAGFIKDLNLAAISEKIKDVTTKVKSATIESDTAKTVVEKVTTVLYTVKKAITGVIDTIKSFKMGDFLTKIKEIGVNLVNGLKEGLSWESIKQHITDFCNKVIDWVENLFGVHSPSIVFEEIGKNLWEGLVKGLTGAWNAVSSFFTKAVEWIKEKFSSIDKEKLKEKGADLLKNFVEGLTETWNTAKEKLEPIFEKLKQMFLDLDTEDIKNLTESLMFIKAGDASSSWGKVGDSINTFLGGKGLTKNMDSLTKSVTNLIDNIGKKQDSFGDTCIKIAKSLLILAVALIAMTLVDGNKLWNATGIIASVIAELCGVALLFNKTGATSAFSKMATAMLELGAAMILIGVSLAILAGVIELLGLINEKKMTQGLNAIMTLVGCFGALFLVVGVFSQENTNAGVAFLAFAGGILLIANAMLIIAGAIELIGSIKPDKVAQAEKIMLEVMLGAVVAFVAVALVSQESAVPAASFAIFAGSVVVMANAMLIIAGAIAMMGVLGVDKIEAGGNAIVKIMALCIVAFAAVEILANSTSDAASFVIMSAGVLVLANAMLVMAAAIAVFGNMDPSSLSQGLTVFITISAVIVALLGVVALASVLAKDAAADFLIFAAGVLILAISMEAMAKAVEKLGMMDTNALIQGGIALAAILVAITGLAAIVQATGLTGTMLLMAASFDLISAAAIKFAAAIAILNVIVAVFGSAFAVQLGIILVALAAGLVMFVVEILAGVSDILEAVKMAGDSIYELVMWAFEIIFKAATEAALRGLISLLDTLVELMPMLNDYFEKLQPEINRLLDTIATIVIEFIMDLIVDIIKALFDFFDDLQKKIPDFEEKLDTFLNGLVDFIVAFLLLLPTVLYDVLIGVVNGLAEIIETRHTELLTAVKRLWNAVKTAFLEDISAFLDIGKELVLGIAKGVKDNIDKIKGEITEAASKVTGWFKNLFGIKSPSRVMAEMGMYLDLGLAKGISDNTDSVTDATTALGKEEMKTMANVVSGIADAMNDGLDDPVIRPVLDLSQVEEDASRMSRMLDTSSQVKMVANSAYDPYSYYDGTPRINAQSAIIDLKEEFGNMVNKMAQMQIVLDSGELVGGIVNDMDKALGKNMVYAARGI